MKRTMWIVAGLMLVAMSGAQPSPDRLNQIWSYALDRVERQHDAWFSDGDYPAAIQLLRFEVELSPNDYEAATNLGWMLENIQEWDDALASYERYRRDNPNDPDRALPSADFYYRRKNYSPIPDLLEPAIASKRKPHPNVYRILAHAYEKTGKLQDAQRVWKAYLAVAPNDGPAKANLARVEKKLSGK